MSHGIIWFLNIVYSWDLHRKEQENPQENEETEQKEKEVELLEPFGQVSEAKIFGGPMKGTEQFPALFIEDYACLPGQNDGHNCGISALVVTAILMRDLIGTTQEKSDDFDALFSRNEMPVYSSNPEFPEVSCVLRKGTVSPLPEPNTGTYLQKVKVEIFRFFDRLAELQYVEIHNRLGLPLDPNYFKIKKLLTSWPPTLIPLIRGAGEAAQILTSSISPPVLVSLDESNDVKPPAKETKTAPVASVKVLLTAPSDDQLTLLTNSYNKQKPKTSASFSCGCYQCVEKA